MKRISTDLEYLDTGRITIDADGISLPTLPLTIDNSVGTRVMAGDIMVHGDTGWRNVSSEIIAPWSGNVYMKRNFNTVEIRFEGVFRGENAYDVMNIASGFRSTILRGQGPRIVLHQADSVANQTRFRIQGDKVLAVSSGNTGPYYGTILYLTDDPWPTMLPGTPF